MDNGLIISIIDAVAIIGTSIYFNNKINAIENNPNINSYLKINALEKKVNLLSAKVQKLINAAHENKLDYKPKKEKDNKHKDSDDEENNVNEDSDGEDNENEENEEEDEEDSDDEDIRTALNILNNK